MCLLDQRAMIYKNNNTVEWNMVYYNKCLYYKIACTMKHAIRPGQNPTSPLYCEHSCSKDHHSKLACLMKEFICSQSLNCCFIVNTLSHTHNMQQSKEMEWLLKNYKNIKGVNAVNYSPTLGQADLASKWRGTLAFDVLQISLFSPLTSMAPGRWWSRIQ